MTSSRSAYENLLKGLALRETQERQRQFAEHGWNLFALPIEDWNAYKEPRALEDLDFIVTHVTDVKGGFGVSKLALSKWLRRLRANQPGLYNSTGYEAIDSQLVDAGVWTPAWTFDETTVHRCFTLVGGSDQLPLLARRLALWERYRGKVPYHQIGAANGDNVANRELEHVTWHGSLGNFGVGWSLDVGHSQDLENWHIETGRASLETLYRRIMAVSSRAQAKGVRLAPHRAFSGKRLADTDYRVHREVVLPVVHKLDGLDIDYEMRKGTGRPVPDTWDDNALFDAKGNRLSSTVPASRRDPIGD